MKKNVITVHDNSMINIGYVGDESSTLVRIPVTSFISKYGNDGVFGLTHVPPGAETGHPVATITVRDGFVEWVVGSEELSEYGDGEAQLSYAGGDGVAHTKIWKTHIHRSLADTADTPEPWQPWVDKLYEYKQGAEDAVSHYPHIDEDTGNWVIWNPALNDWEDTGVTAHGDRQGQSDWNQDDQGEFDFIKNKPFDSVDLNTLTVENGVLSVNVTDDAESGNSMPITSSGVNTIVGNINVLLSFI